MACLQRGHDVADDTFSFSHLEISPKLECAMKVVCIMSSSIKSGIKPAGKLFRI